ncbi:spondin domain-containing protein [Thiohalomonas denitrificans]|uniref:spondin domain-containing protein n=1 Tax=Thiohalomonas denitrificans TaxID=415747 RepID=UPI0026ED8B20|nr:spondin domain-containing protein [Thiohalomonas denitrificans]
MHKNIAIAGLLLGSLTGSMALADDGKTYQVTVTNLTRGEVFTPVLVASHSPASLLFTEGAPASMELSALAEGGATAPLKTLLDGDERVRDTATAGGPVPPGGTVSITIQAKKRDHVSMAAMLVPTNDGFFAVQSAALPKEDQETVTLYAPAYDAGSEPNDELCLSIPGPAPICAGEGISAGIGGEGYVHIHAGIHGIGDLSAASHDWRNPVAKVTIEQVKE